MKFGDLVKETITSTGTGAFILGGAISPFRAFAAVYAVGERVPYRTAQGDQWEIGVGTKTAGGIARTTITASTNGGQAVNFGAGAEIHANAGAAQLAKFELGTSERVVYTSSLCASDADLSEGSTTFGADNTAVIQAVLDSASSTSPLRLIFDGRYSSTGWRIKGNTSIEALPGCGAILRTGSNKSLFENYNITFDPNARVDSNITIRGGIWNGNRGARTNGENSPGANNSKSDGVHGLNCIFRFYGVTNLVFEPDTLLCSPCYSTHVMNCQRVTSRGVRHNCGSNPIVNNDGHNTSGNSSDIVYRDLIMNTADDPLSISPDDVWGGSNTWFGSFYSSPVNGNGPISNVLVDGLNLQTNYYGVRLMAPLNRLDNVVIRNITGYTTGWAVLLDNYMDGGGLPNASGNGNIGAVTIDGVDVKVVGGIIGNPAVIRIKSSVEKLTIRNLRRGGFGDNIPTILIGGVGVNIGTLEIDGYDSDDLASSQVISHIKMTSGTIRKLRIRSANLRRAGGANGSKFIEMTGGSIDTVVLDGVNLDGIDSLISNTGGTIKKINATNITHENGFATFQTTGTIARLNVSGYIGTQVSSGTFTTVTGDATATAAPAAPAHPTVSQMTPITYPIGDATVTNNGSNVWTTTARDFEPANGYRVHGRASPLKIAAGADGFICTQHATAMGGIYASFGLATTYSATAPIAYGFILYENTSMVTNVTNAAQASTGVAEVIGNYYGVRRVGSTVTLETSSDGINWTVIYTWPGGSNTDLYPMFYIAGDASANLYHPLQVGFA